MFGSNNGSDSTTSSSPPKDASSLTSGTSPPGPPTINTASNTTEKKRKGSKASQLIASAKNTISSTINSSNNDSNFKVIYKDDQLPSPGAVSNAAGDSKPTARNTFRVGVTEDKNKKCRRTMEDTHSFVYNFLQSQGTGLPAHASNSSNTNAAEELAESDNGYFAIFDGHAGTYAADWCGRKLHVVLEDTIRRHPNTPIPELLDMTFTNCDGQLEKLPVKNSGCTAVCAVLRWEDRRVPGNEASGTGDGKHNVTTSSSENSKPSTASPDFKTERQRVLYTANVGDARIVLCRNGKALRLSYDHKGSDESEGKRVANAGGLILNNRVNGVLAVTRALGDSYMKELVTGHPYTTETVLLPDSDEFIILACDGLWDVCSDQEAVDLVRGVQDPQEASKMLVDYALSRFSSDNLSCMIVRMDTKGRFGNSVSPPVKGSADTVDGDIADKQKPVDGDPPKDATVVKDMETKVKTPEKLASTPN